MFTCWWDVEEEWKRKGAASFEVEFAEPWRASESKSASRDSTDSTSLPSPSRPRTKHITHDAELPSDLFTAGLQARESEFSSMYLLP